jgi:hypothetical protein
MSRRALGEDGPWNDPHADYDPTEAYYDHEDREAEWRREAAHEAELEAQANAVPERDDPVEVAA